MIEFSKAQQKTLATGLTLLALSVVIAFVVFIFWILLKVLSYVSGAIIPVVVGLFLAMFFKPYYIWWRGMVKNPTLALTLMLLSVLVPLGIGVWQFGSFAAEQATNLIGQAPELASKFQNWFDTTFPRGRELAASMGISFRDWIEFSKGKAMNFGVGAISHLSAVVSWLVGLIFFVHFLMQRDMRGEDYVREIPFLKPETRSFVAEQVNAFQDILVNFFQRQVVICLIEGVLYGLGFMLVGLPYGFIIGFVLGVLNLIPLFGSVSCLPVALPLAYFGAGGSLSRLIGVLVVWLLGQLLDGYFITPKIQGQKTGLGYAGVIFSFFFWSVVFHSILGLLLAIPLSAFCVVLWRALKQRYIRPLV